MMIETRLRPHLIRVGVSHEGPASNCVAFPTPARRQPHRA